jgi:hypothetical protein
VTRARKLFTDWQEGQGAKIKSARPLATYGACASMARRMAETLPPEYSRLLLLQEQIETPPSAPFSPPPRRKANDKEISTASVGECHRGHSMDVGC